MAEYVTLLGTEQIQHAANSIRDAAEEMTRAALYFADSINRMERLVERIEAVANQVEAP